MDNIAAPTLTASEVCDALGRKAISERLGVGIAAVSNASNDGRFPARWFPTIRAMCEEAGVNLSESLFNFIPATSPARLQLPSSEDVPATLSIADRGQNAAGSDLTQPPTEDAA